VWNDMESRSPLLYRFLPLKFVDWDQDGAKIHWLFWRKKSSKVMKLT